MKRYIKMSYSLDVSSIDEIQGEIQAAIDEGTTFDDINDYLDELYNNGKLSNEEVSKLIDWADGQLKSALIRLDEDKDLIKLVENAMPKKGNVGIIYSFEIDEDSVNLYANCDQISEYYEEDLEDEAISKLEGWAQRIIDTLPLKYDELGESLSSQLGSDWFSGMTFGGASSPYTYDGFMLAGYQED